MKALNETKIHCMFRFKQLRMILHKQRSKTDQKPRREFYTERTFENVDEITSLSMIVDSDADKSIKEEKVVTVKKQKRKYRLMKGVGNGLAHHRHVQFESGWKRCICLQ